MGATNDRIKALMTEAGMKQKDLAAATGMTESAVSRMLEGKTERELSATEAQLFLDEFNRRTRREPPLTVADVFRPEPVPSEQGAA